MSIKLTSSGVSVSASRVPVLDMAGDERVVDFDWEPQTMKGTFSQLLFADDLTTLELSETTSLGSSFRYRSPYSKQYPPQMLCFGNSKVESAEVELEPVLHDPARSRNNSKRSTTSSSTSRSTSSRCLPTSNNMSEGCLHGPARSSSSIVSSAPAVNGRSSKRSKTGNAPSASNGQTRGRRENKLGERIAALQQLVSPYGKTDTASVLHEAMGYIRFLHEQVQVLCSPYLQQLPSSPQPPDGRGIKEEESISCSRMRNLRSQGLCLVPLACSAHLAACNGADFWSPATGNTSLSFSSSPLHR